jgi:predicted porin
VGLEGDFGKLKLGQQWRPMFTAIAATDPTQLSATPGFAGAGKGGTGLSGLASEPNSDTITYNLPSFTPGLFIQLQHGFANTTQGENSGGHIIFTDGKKFFVTYAVHNEKMLKDAKFMASLTGTNGVDKTLIAQGRNLAELTIGGLNGLNHVLYSSNGGDNRESSGLAGTYDFGFVKLVAGYVTEKVNGTSAKLDMNVLGAKVPLSERVNVGYLHSIAAHTREAETKFTLSGDKLLLTYDLSKRTTVYYAYGKQQLDGGTSNGYEFSTTMDAIGLRHTF